MNILNTIENENSDSEECLEKIPQNFKGATGRAKIICKERKEYIGNIFTYYTERICDHRNSRKKETKQTEES